MIMLLIASGVALALMGYRVTQWMREIPDRNEDFDAMSATAFIERRHSVSAH
ncbi:hypothetical protein EDC30_10977 [Paucimonas lemoignei]|uniref:Uncharacterized protein n=1 Tax=Paucimonas lemoignei TaxID=29443 RepID=A0A4R3HS69_PAULE|nr:hypothetical protein [Paucimonas lemoignei]TCS35778.1 hypothetical protein EDC30_10977 [Paucimonas lemoignei]